MFGAILSTNLDLALEETVEKEGPQSTQSVKTISKIHARAAKHNLIR